MLFVHLVEVVDPVPHHAALNMAIDEILLRSARLPTLRLYTWQRPAVSFGYFGIAAQVISMFAAREPVRRWSGGGVVCHGEDVTYSVIVPRQATFFAASPRESYRAIHAGIAALIPEAALIETAPDERADLCFAAPSQHDIMRAGVKIAGAAQRRTRDGLLHQGSIQMSEGDGGIRGSLAGALGGQVVRRELTPSELEQAELVAAEKYGSEAWLFRR